MTWRGSVLEGPEGGDGSGRVEQVAAYLIAGCRRRFAPAGRDRAAIDRRLRAESAPSWLAAWRALVMRCVYSGRGRPGYFPPGRSAASLSTPRVRRAYARAFFFACEVSCLCGTVSFCSGESLRGVPCLLRLHGRGRGMGIFLSRSPGRGLWASSEPSQSAQNFLVRESSAIVIQPVVGGEDPACTAFSVYLRTPRTSERGLARLPQDRGREATNWAVLEE